MNIPTFPIHNKTQLYVCWLYEGEDMQTVKFKKKDDITNELSKYPFSKVQITQVDRYNRILSVCEVAESYYSFAAYKRIRGKLKSITTYIESPNGLVLKYKQFDKDMERELMWTDNGIFGYIVNSDGVVIKQYTHIEKRQRTFITKYHKGKTKPEEKQHSKKIISGYKREGGVIEYQHPEYKVVWTINEDRFADCEVCFLDKEKCR